MRAKQVIYTWDYHHGQATRVIMGGLPPIPGDTMRQKQASFFQSCDYIRTSLMQEPRGHANMLGAVITDPVTSDGDFGLLFLSPQGFFEMCGDSTFSAVAALVDSGMLPYQGPDETLEVKLDTVAGRVHAQVRIEACEPVAITFNNVPSFDLGETEIKIAGMGNVRALLGYGGLTYAFIRAQDIGIKSLKEYPRDELLEIGTRLWLSAREEILLPGYLGPERIGEM